MGYSQVVIYEALCFDVAQGQINAVPNKIRNGIFTGTTTVSQILTNFVNERQLRTPQISKTRSYNQMYFTLDTPILGCHTLYKLCSQHFVISADKVHTVFINKT